MKNILIVVCMDVLLLFMATFCAFVSVRYMKKNEKPERILFFAMGFICIFIAIITSICILT